MANTHAINLVNLDFLILGYPSLPRSEQAGESLRKAVASDTAGDQIVAIDPHTATKPS
jgi:hypothetical protein